MSVQSILSLINLGKKYADRWVVQNSDLWSLCADLNPSFLFTECYLAGEPPSLSFGACSYRSSRYRCYYAL